MEYDSAPRVRAGDGGAPFTIVGPDGVALALRFDSLDDFTPEAIARQVDALRAMCEERSRLVDMLDSSDGDTRAEEFMAWMMDEPPAGPPASPAPHDAGAPAAGTGRQPAE